MFFYIENIVLLRGKVLHVQIQSTLAEALLQILIC